MGIQNFLSNVQAAEAILNLAAQSMILLLAGWIFSLLLKRTSAPVRSGSLLAILVILALWPLETVISPKAAFGLYRIPVEVPALDAIGLSGESRVGVYNEAIPVSAARPFSNASDRAADTVRRGAPLDRRAFSPVIKVLNGLGWLWFLGTLVFLGRFFYGIAFLAGFRSSLKEVRDPRLIEILEDVRTAVPAMRFPPVFSSPAVKSPIAFGLRRPRIVLPDSLLPHLSPAEFQSLLIHEAAHLRHRDQLVGIVQRIVAAFYWWNPLIHALNARFSLAREEVSDNYGILENGARPYAESLVELAQKTNMINRFPSAVGIATPHISLEERIMNIVSKNRNLRTRLAKPVGVVLVVIALALALFTGSRGLILTAAEAQSDLSAPPKIVPLPLVKWPTAMTVGKDRIYLLDFDRTRVTNEIKILSASDYSLLKSFGKRGEGLGEFLLGPGLPRIEGNSLWCDDIQKIIVFSPDGDFQKEIPFPKKLWTGAGFSPLPVGENYVAFTSDYRQSPDGGIQWIGQVYDREFRVIKQFAPGIPSSSLFPPPPPPPPPPAGQKEAVEKAVTRPKTDYQAIPECIDYAVADHKIFYADTRDGFRIAVFDAQGNPLYDIKKDYDKLKVPTNFQDTYMTLIREKSAWLLNVANFKYREVYPAFMSFQIDGGKIYVATYAHRNGMNELIIMNLKGDILKRSFSFPLSPDYNQAYHNFNVMKNSYAIHDGKIYFLMKNEKTNGYELHIKAIE